MTQENCQIDILVDITPWDEMILPSGFAILSLGMEFSLQDAKPNSSIRVRNYMPISQMASLMLYVHTVQNE